MGTRGSYGFRLADKDYVVYNHYDSYPSGLGADVVDFLLSEFKTNGYDDSIGLLKQRVRSMEEIDTNVKPTEIQKKFLEPYTDLGVSNRSRDDWYCLLRLTQGDIEKTLSARYYSPADDFLLDGLFCEYAYIVNLDTEMLEFYKGFEKNNIKGRYGAMENPEKNRTGYGAVSLVAEFPLSELKESTYEEMEKLTSDEDEED